MEERLKEEIRDAIATLAIAIRNNTELKERQLQILEPIQYLNNELTEYTNPHDLTLCKRFSKYMDM